MEGVWNGINVSIEWQPNKWFTLRSSQEHRTLIGGFVQVLGFTPALSYTDENGTFVVEWWRGEDEKTKRLQEIMGHPIYTNLKTYKR